MENKKPLTKLQREYLILKLIRAAEKNPEYKKQLENSLITINNQKENAQLAQEVFDYTNNNYTQGLAALTDLLDAENAMVEAQNNYTNAILEYKLAEIQFIKSKGELKTLTNK